MLAAQKLGLISVDEYLQGELQSNLKHEYLGGFVHAMVGGSNKHNLISTNVLASLHFRLRGHRCRPYNSDTKIRIQLPSQVRFYYPDVSVICDSNAPRESFQDSPLVLVEVLSRATRRTDTVEKLDAYKSIPSLSTYMIVEQDEASVTIFRRVIGDFDCETISGLKAHVSLPEIGIELPLREFYDGVEFSPEPDSDQGVN